MARYLIEFRIIDRRAKAYMKSLANNVLHKFKIGPDHYVPHISLVGGFETSDENRLIRDFENLCTSYPVMHFKIKGFNTFEENRVIYLDIEPNENFKKFRYELARTVKPYCRLKQPYDFHSIDEFVFHSTIAMNIPYSKFEQLKRYIFPKDIPLKTEYVLVRVTLLKYAKILREYDFLQRKLLTRFEAKSPLFYRKTEKLLEDYLLGKYDPDRYIPPPSVETRQQDRGFTDDASKEGQLPLPSLPEYHRNPFQDIVDYFKPPKVFVISDLHLDHSNIIQYCHRPFINAGKMNSELLTNWNSIVRKKDKVYFIGDLVFGRSKRTPEYWIEKLQSKIELIGGNHDHSENLKFLPNCILEYKGKRFYLVHDPADTPKDWEGWTIHGHHHNNNLVEFPFINGINKTINVGAELLNYRPLDLDNIFDLDFEHIKYMQDINAQPQRFD